MKNTLERYVTVQIKVDPDNPNVCGEDCPYLNGAVCNLWNQPFPDSRRRSLACREPPFANRGRRSVSYQTLKGLDFEDITRGLSTFTEVAQYWGISYFSIYTYLDNHYPNEFLEWRQERKAQKQLVPFLASDWKSLLGDDLLNFHSSLYRRAHELGITFSRLYRYIRLAKDPDLLRWYRAYKHGRASKRSRNFKKGKNLK